MVPSNEPVYHLGDPYLSSLLSRIQLYVPLMILNGGNGLAPPTEGERVAWGRLPAMI